MTTIVRHDGPEVASADLSADGVYRYRLLRRWNREAPILCGIFLNPSTADAFREDQTCRRFRTFAVREGMGGYGIWNLFGYRTRDPKVLAKAHSQGIDVVGPENNRRLRNLLSWAYRANVPVVVGWGATTIPGPAKLMERRVEWLLDQAPGGGGLYCLGTTKDGHPRHPLMVSAQAQLEPWRP